MRENQVVEGNQGVLTETVEEVVGLRCPECGRGNMRRSRQETLSSVLLNLIGRTAYRCRECRKRFFGPSDWAEKLPEKPAAAPMEVALSAAASTGSSSYFVTPRPAESFSPPPPAVPAERCPVLLLAAGSLADLESLEVSVREMNGTQTFSLPGAHSSIRTRSPRPAFLVSGHLADELELYQLEVSDGRRVLLYAVKEERVAFPASTAVEPVWEGVMSVSPAYFLAPGEYAWSPRTTNQFFLFGVD